MKKRKTSRQRLIQRRKAWYRKCKALNFVCWICGKEKDFENLTKDHVVPLSKGGSRNIKNILPACKECNEIRGNRWGKDWLVDAKLASADKIIIVMTRK